MSHDHSRPAPVRRGRKAAVESLEPRLVLAATPVVIDLLAVYSQSLAPDPQTEAHLQSLIQASVDSMNQAMINTHLSITVRLVHAESINYNGSNDLFTDRMRLETPGDGYLDSIFSLRSQYDADVVTLITDGNVSGGNADLMTDINDPNNSDLAFSAIAANSIGPGNLTLAHELGHTLGAGHERNNPTQPVAGAFPYSYGYRFSTPSPSASYNDIMSYSYGTDIPLFSYANPNVLEHGVPTGLPSGDPNSADIAATFVQTAPIVAAYGNDSLPSHVQDTTAPSARLFETNRAGSSLTFTIRYTDDSGIDLSTIGAGDVTVSGPGGFSLPATFISMDNPTVAGAYKLATYHVILPATDPATSSLAFNLQSGAIRDIHGNSAASGAIANHTAYYAGSPYDFGAGYAAYTWAQPLSTSLSPGAAINEYGALSPDDVGHFYSLTLTQAATVEATMSGMTNNGDIRLYADSNNNDLNDDAALTSTGYNSGTADEGVHATLGPGTYYIFVDVPNTSTSTSYVLSLHAIANDTTPPTAVADTRDVTTSGAPYVDFAVTYTDPNFVDGVKARFNGAIDIHAQLANGGDFTFYYYPDSGLNGAYQDATSKTIYFRVFAFDSNTGWTSGNNGTYTLSIHDNGGSSPNVQDASGNSIAISTIGSFKIAIGQTDLTAPNASLSAAPPVAGTSTWQFNVIYQDGSGLDTNSFGNGNIRVTGPNSFDQLATFVAATQPSTIGGTQTVTYSLNAPGGYWDSTDAGAYTISLQSNQVKDSAGNFAAAMSFAPVIASDADLTSLGASGVQFNGTSANDTMRIDADASFVYFNLNDSSLYFVATPSVPRFTVNSLGGDDTIDYQSGSMSGSVVGGTGNNTLNVTGGTLVLDADGGAASSVLSVSVDSATLIFNATQHLAGLSLSGAAIAGVAPGPGRVLSFHSLAIDSTSKLDMGSATVLFDYSGPTPVDSIRSLLARGFQSGWTGTGIISSTAATGGGKSIWYGEATDLFSTFPGTFAGESIDSTTLILRVALGGDANLDGLVNADDLGHVALNWAAQSGKDSGRGDFNYDGRVDVGDLLILANNWQKTLDAPAAPVAPAPARVAPSAPVPAPRLAPPARGAPVAPAASVTVAVTPVPVVQRTPPLVAPPRRSPPARMVQQVVS